MIVIETTDATVSTRNSADAAPQAPATRTTPSRGRGVRGRAIRRHRQGQTLPEVQPEELGDEKERNQADPATRLRETPEFALPQDGETARIRSELARNLLGDLDQLVPLVGDIALATKLQCLKRGLARCHDELKGHTSEAAYLSIVTLVESAMTQLKWKQYTREKLATFRKVLEVGYQKARLDFADYDHARHELAAQHLDTTPRIDLASLTPEDLADDEEDEE